MGAAAGGAGRVIWVCSCTHLSAVTRGRYRQHAEAVEFRPTNVEVLARGTCLSADPEAYWYPPGRIALQTKSDVFRLLVQCLRH